MRDRMEYDSSRISFIQFSEMSIGFLWGMGISANYIKQFYEDVR